MFCAVSFVGASKFYSGGKRRAARVAVHYQQCALRWDFFIGQFDDRFIVLVFGDDAEFPVVNTSGFVCGIAQFDPVVCCPCCVSDFVEEYRACGHVFLA